jgi:hypothetical protein
MGTTLPKKVLKNKTKQTQKSLKFHNTSALRHACMHANKRRIKKPKLNKLNKTRNKNLGEPHFANKTRT